MATYCIGDVHGCFSELQSLLQRIDYAPTQDVLWFVGDIVNRGPHSLQVLRFIASLPNVRMVLGNHDFYLLCLYYRIFEPSSPVLSGLLAAADIEELISWLEQQPLAFYDKQYNCIVTHAGVYPSWGLEQVMDYSNEIRQLLSTTSTRVKLLENLYGDQPNRWQEHLRGWDRARFIINAFTRMRFCSCDGQLDFEFAGIEHPKCPDYLPWFQIPGRKTEGLDILFGHWASLNGRTNDPHAIALDTGCAWGQELTALRLEDHRRFSVPKNLVVA